MPLADMRDLVDSLASAVEMVEPDLAALAQAADAHVRDAADEPVLATLLASAAQAPVTGDRDLLALADRYSILSPAGSCARHAL